MANFDVKIELDESKYKISSPKKYCGSNSGISVGSKASTKRRGSKKAMARQVA